MPDEPERRSPAPMMIRAAEVRPSSYRAEDNSIEIVWTTGAAGMRFDWVDGSYYMEELDVSPTSVRLDRLNAGACLLDSHETYTLRSVLGSVVPGSAIVDGAQGTARVRLATTPDVADTNAKIIDGHIRSVSVGYNVFTYVRTEREGEYPHLLATDWEPIELSMVAVPFDAGAQVRARSAEQGGTHPCIIRGDAASTDTMEIIMADAIDTTADDVVDANTTTDTGTGEDTSTALVVVDGTRSGAVTLARISEACRGLGDADARDLMLRHETNPFTAETLLSEVTNRYAERNTVPPINNSRTSPGVVTRDGDTATSASIARMLRDALPGVHVTSTTGGKHVANSYHYKGQAVDFVPKGGMASMTKDDVRRLFTSRGIDIVELLGPGDKGHSDHFHVAWTNGKNALAEFGDAAKRAKEAQHELDTALAGVLATFDPATAAAKKYRDELAAIDELVAKGKLTPETGERLKFQPTVDAAAGQTRTTLDTLLDRAGSDFEAWRDAQDRAQHAIVDSWLTAADSFRNAASSIADLLGIQLKGPARALLQPGGIEGQATDTAKALTDTLVRAGLKIRPESLNKLTSDLGTVIGNASYGQVGGSVFSSITGGKESKAGSAIGGIIGGELGKTASAGISKALGGALGPTLGKALGSAAGPLGALVGGAVVGGVLGALFKKKSPSGSVDITGTDASSATASGKLGSALTGNASAVQKSLTQIAEQLGAVTGAFSVSIGKSGDWYHVAGTAGADVSAAHPKSPLIYEGKDEAAAVQAALLNALQDGAIKGISAASQRILQSGQDLDAALTKALAIESVPKDLKAMLDPVGAAIDTPNAKWKKTVDALNEGGASAEQMAQAERLYNLQLDQTKNSTSSASQALKDFLTSLKIGSSSPYSLRDQETTARAQLQPYLDQIAAGQSIDQSKYQTAATAFLDIERQLYGSTQAYFDAMDTVQAATNKAISAIDNAEPITTAVESPFAKATAASAATTAANTQTGNELLSQLSEQLGSLQAAVEALGAGGYVASGFIGADRLFASAA